MIDEGENQRALGRNKELTMPNEHGDFEDSEVSGVMRPELAKSPQTTWDDIGGNCSSDTGYLHQVKISGTNGLSTADESEIPQEEGDLQPRGYFGSAIPVKDIVPRHPCVLRGRVRRTILVRDLNGPSFECLLDDETGSVVLVFLGRSFVPGLFAGATLQVQGTPGTLGNRIAIINPLYEFLSETVDAEGRTQLQKVRSSK